MLSTISIASSCLAWWPYFWFSKVLHHIQENTFLQLFLSQKNKKSKAKKRRTEEVKAQSAKCSNIRKVQGSKEKSSKAVKRSNCSTVLSDFGSANINLIFTMIKIITTIALDIFYTNVAIMINHKFYCKSVTDFIQCDQEIWFWKTGGKWFKLVCSAIRRELEHPSQQFLPQKQQGLKLGIIIISSALFSPFLFKTWLVTSLSLVFSSTLICWDTYVLKGLILNNVDSLMISHWCHNKFSAPQYLDIFLLISWYNLTDTFTCCHWNPDIFIGILISCH